MLEIKISKTILNWQVNKWWLLNFKLKKLLSMNYNKFALFFWWDFFAFLNKYACHFKSPLSQMKGIKYPMCNEAWTSASFNTGKHSSFSFDFHFPLNFFFPSESCSLLSYVSFNISLCSLSHKLFHFNFVFPCSILLSRYFEIIFLVS